jgi:hypothetical protein
MGNNNKLIAQFMGNDTDEYGSDVYVPKEMMFNSKSKCMQGVFDFNECEFHTDWNWLMPVIRKIEELGNDVLITTNYIQIAYDEGEQFIVIDDLNIKIDSVYNAVVEFINWYNKQ